MREIDRNRPNRDRRTLLSRVIYLLIIPVMFAVSSAAQESDSSPTNSNANSASAAPTPAPSPIPLSAIVTEADAATSRLGKIRDDLGVKQDVAEIENELPTIQDRVNAREAETRTLLASTPTLDELRVVEREWQTAVGRLPGWKKVLQSRLSTIEAHLSELGRMNEQWSLTLKELTTSEPGITEENTSVIPIEITERINSILGEIAKTQSEAEARRTALIGIQTRISDLETRARVVLENIKESRDQTLTDLFAREESPIWTPNEDVTSIGDLARRSWHSLVSQFSELREYVSGHTSRFVVHGLVFILISSVLFWARGRIRPYVEKEPKLEPAAQIFELPIITGLIISVILSGRIYPESPRVLSALLWAAVLVPVVILLRRLVDKPLFIVLNSLVVLFFVDRLRELLTGQPLAARAIFLAEMLGAILFLVWFLKTKRLERKIEARHHSVFRSIRKVIPFVVAFFAVAFVANAVGFVSLSYVLGNGVLSSAYLALVIYTAVQIIRSLVVFALRVTPLVNLQAVRSHRPIVRDKLLRFVNWLAVIVWLLGVVNLFSVRDAVFGYIRSILSYTVGYGSISISLGDVLLFAATVWVTLLISRFLRFILEEDVYPRVDLGTGVSYAVSTILHYAVLVGGFMLAIAALGVDFSKFALIAGAVGIGIGFGLQNIINNFISGLILLFERPVKVNDTVQIGEHIGSLKQIGLRASVLRKVDGSDVIVPNSQLISEEVINWTMSDDKRRIDIPVGVAYGTEPKKVIELLIGLTERYPSILQEPGSKALFLGMGESSLDFELRVWTNDTEGWVGMRSDLVTDVYTVLTEAGIEIPFPQRDLNFRNVDAAIIKEIKNRVK